MDAILTTTPAPASTPDLRQRALPESASILLDIVRFSAAILVVIAHATHPEFNAGLRDKQILGDIAVPVFFVLSGFVIRFVTQTRETTAREYFIDRASRIYSVVLPALAFTLLVGAICYGLDSTRFVRDGWASTFDHPFARLALNLTFLSQAWGHNTIPFIDSPFWSLGYECVYYALFGIAIFARGWKRIAALALVAAIIGPQVLFLLPIWWLGCYIYDAYQATRHTRLRTILLAVAALYLLAAATLAAFGHRLLLAAPLHLFWIIAHLTNPILWLHLQPNRSTMFAVAVGLYSAAALFLLLLAIDPIHVSRSNPWVRRFRRIAEGTFAIYLIHYPFLVLVTFLGLIRYQRTVTNILTICLICILLILASGPIDQLKRVMRRRLHATLP